MSKSKARLRTKRTPGPPRYARALRTEPSALPTAMDAAAASPLSQGDDGKRWIAATLLVAISRKGTRCPHRGKSSEEHTSELQSLMRIAYDVCCFIKKNKDTTTSL